MPGAFHRRCVAGKCSENLRRGVGDAAEELIFLVEPKHSAAGAGPQLKSFRAQEPFDALGETGHDDREVFLANE